MKKTAIALALGGLIAVPTISAADTTIYGSFRISENYSKIEYKGDRKDQKQWDLRNQSSRLGFRGSEDLGNGLSAIYHWEFGVGTADGATIGGRTNRLAYGGLKGGWGQLTLGTQWNPYYFAVAGEVDVFNAAFSANGYYAAAGLNNFDSTRSTNQILYKSPSFGNFTAHVGIMTDADGGENNIDQWQLAGIYDNGPLFIGAAYRQLAEDSTEEGIAKKSAKENNLCDGSPTAPVSCEFSPDNMKQYGVQARYNFDFGLGLAGSYNRVDAKDKLNKWDTYDAVVSYSFGNNIIRGAYFKAKNKDGFEEDNDGFIVGFTHRMSRRTRVWVEYGQTNFDTDENSDDSDDGIFDKDKNFSVGMRHDF